MDLLRENLMSKPSIVWARMHELVLAGKTPAEIAETVRAEGLTERTYQAADVRWMIRTYCARRGLEVPESCRLVRGAAAA